jgi:hypothetical protein
MRFTDHMPENTQRNHPAYKRANSYAAIRATARKPLGPDHVRCLDWDMQTIVVTIGGRRVTIPISGHWKTLGANGYTRWNDGHRTRRLTRAQKRMTTQAWVDRHGGTIAALHQPRRANGDRYLTWEESVTYAKSHGVILTPELKSLAFALPDVAQAMVAVCKKHDYPLWAMALLRMKNCRGKCEAIVGAGGQFAVIFGRFRSMAARRPADWANWRHKPTKIWGPARAKAWLR